MIDFEKQFISDPYFKEAADKVSEKAYSLPEDEILSQEASTLSDPLVQKFHLNEIVIHLSSFEGEKEPNYVQRHGSTFPGGFALDRREDCPYPCVKISFMAEIHSAIPYIFSSRISKAIESNDPDGYLISNCEIDGPNNKLRLSYITTERSIPLSDSTSQKVSTLYKTHKTNLLDTLSQINKKISQFNELLPAYINSIIDRRKEEILRQKELNRQFSNQLKVLQDS